MAIKLFISYAHEDESYRSDFEKHLASLKREGTIDEWHDRLIKPGSEWAREIQVHLDQSNIILLMISPDFMASAYCNEVEVKRAMQRHKMGLSRVIPVLLRPCDWLGTPFSALQALPTEAKPVNDWKDRDSAFLDVTQQLRAVCKELAISPFNPVNPYSYSKIGDWYFTEAIYEFHTAGETKLAHFHLVVTEKSDENAVVKVMFYSKDFGNIDKSINIPLDKPLEDLSAQIMSSFTSQPVPANASITVHPNSGGAEKLFIGQQVYYTTWISNETEVRIGMEHYIQQNKKWLYEEIPLDGIVKTVSEIPGNMTTTMTVIDYGNGKFSKITNKEFDINQYLQTPSNTPSLNQILVGTWQVQIMDLYGQMMMASFEFNTQGGFAGILNSPLYGAINVQGRWGIEQGKLILDGFQNAGFMNMPYQALITFINISVNSIEASSQTGEHIVMARM